MAFIQPCFIRKNTPELRKKLEELGYTNGAWESPHFEYPYLMCFPNKNGKYGLFKGEGFYMTEDDYRCDGERWTYNPPKEYINCDDNEELFLSLAAMRDDSDYMQWFVSPKTHTKRLSGCFGQVVGMDGHYKEIVGYEWHRHENKDNALTERLNAMIQMEVEDMEFLPHKATVEELIEHFKKE